MMAALNVAAIEPVGVRARRSRAHRRRHPSLIDELFGFWRAFEACRVS
jgi:hypothetical protein